MSDDEKDAIRDQVSGNGTETSDDDLDHCESLHYDVDIPTCNNLGKRGDAAAKARCYASAVKRYAACRRGVPMNELPPLDTWNN